MKQKNILMSVLLIMGVTLSSAQTGKTHEDKSENRGYIVKVGDQAPSDFSLVLTDGKTTTLKELRGKTVVLQFTASWCRVCREEMPHLENELWQVYKNRDIVLIGIDRDEPLEKVIKFKEDLKVTYLLALDPGADIFGRFADKKSGVTRNVVIDKNGKIVFLTRLFNTEEFAGLIKVIDKLASK